MYQGVLQKGGSRLMVREGVVADTVLESGNVAYSQLQAGMIRRRGGMARGWGRQVPECRSMVERCGRVCTCLADSGRLGGCVKGVL